MHEGGCEQREGEGREMRGYQKGVEYKERRKRDERMKGCVQNEEGEVKMKGYQRLMRSEEVMREKMDEYLVIEILSAKESESEREREVVCDYLDIQRGRDL